MMLDEWSRHAAITLLREVRRLDTVAKVHIVERKPWKILANIYLTDGKVVQYYLPIARSKGA